MIMIKDDAEVAEFGIRAWLRTMFPQGIESSSLSFGTKNPKAGFFCLPYTFFTK